MNNRTITEVLAETTVAAKETRKTDDKRLIAMMNITKRILWNYIRECYPEIYDQTYGAGNKDVDAAIVAIHDQNKASTSWSANFAYIFKGYDYNYRFVNILQLATYRVAFKEDLYKFQRILKTIENFHDCDWSTVEADKMMAELNSQHLINGISKRLTEMVETYKWKLKHNVLECKKENDDEISSVYVTKEDRKIKFNIIGLNGYYTDSSRLGRMIKACIFDDDYIKLKSLAVSLPQYMDKVIRAAISTRINERIRCQVPLVAVQAECSRLRVQVTEREGEIRVQVEANKRLEKERNDAHAEISRKEGLFATRQNEVHQLRAENAVLKQGSHQRAVKK